MGCYEVAGGGDGTLDIFTRTLGGDANEEDRWVGDEDSTGAPEQASQDNPSVPRRALHANAPGKRAGKITTGSICSGSIGGEEGLGSLLKGVGKLCGALAKKHENEEPAWKKSQARDDMFARMVVADGCPPELRGQIAEYFQTMLAQANAEKIS